MSNAICDSPSPIRTQVHLEGGAMTRYALELGLCVPLAAAKTIERLAADQPVAVEDALDAHAVLTDLIAPARPCTVLLLEQEQLRNPRLVRFGAAPIVRHLMLAATACVVLVVGLSTLEMVDGNVDPLVEHGLPLLANMLYVLASAGLGAAFNALFQLQLRISERTYDDREDSVIWSQLVLGMVSGLILVVFGPLDINETALMAPTVALLGGFSSSAVFRILLRMVQAIERLADQDDRRLERAIRSRGAAQSGRDEALLARIADLEVQLSGTTADPPDGTPEEVADDIAAHADAEDADDPPTVVAPRVPTLVTS